MKAILRRAYTESISAMSKKLMSSKASEMALWVKVPAPKLDDVNFDPWETHDKRNRQTHTHCPQITHVLYSTLMPLTHKHREHINKISF